MSRMFQNFLVDDTGQYPVLKQGWIVHALIGHFLIAPQLNLKKTVSKIIVEFRALTEVAHVMDFI